MVVTSFLLILKKKKKINSSIGRFCWAAIGRDRFRIMEFFSIYWMFRCHRMSSNIEK